MVEKNRGFLDIQASLILHFLDQKPDDVIPSFVKSLREGAHEHVAEIFDVDDGNGRNKANCVLTMMCIFLFPNFLSRI